MWLQINNFFIRGDRLLMEYIMQILIQIFKYSYSWLQALLEQFGFYYRGWTVVLIEFWEQSLILGIRILGFRPKQ